MKGDCIMKFNITRLKTIMAEKQMNQLELSQKIGKSKSSISQYLSGRTVPPESIQEKIASVLGCTVEDLNEEDECNVYELKNVSISECARILGKSEQFVRIALQTGAAPFGFAVKTSSIWSYHISAKRLKEYMGELS